jgi:beta-galactosidase
MSLTLLGVAQSQTRSSDASPARQRLSLDRGWLFHEGDIPFPVITGHQPSYDNAKAGSSSGAASPEYDDSSWKRVNLPHDWAVAQPFDPHANISQGYRRRGMGWYRRYFRLDPSVRGKHLEIQLDGIATHSTIWVNGVLSARNWSGYNSIYIDITPFARYGSDLNVIAVQVDANAMEGWWYEGAGMYRHTWLVERNPVHIVTDGVFANPVRNADMSWSIPVETTLYSIEEKPTTVRVESTLYDRRQTCSERTSGCNRSAFGRIRCEIHPPGHRSAALVRRAPNLVHGAHGRRTRRCCCRRTDDP